VTMSKRNDEQAEGIIVVPIRNGVPSKKRIGPFRNGKSVRNWLSSNAYAADMFQVIHPNGEMTMVQGAAP